jgi:hypothetical protein
MKDKNYMRKLFMVLAILVGPLLLSLPAAGQVWYTGFNNTGTALANGASMSPPNIQAHPSAVHFKVYEDSTTDSNTLNVSLCNEVIVTVYNDTADGSVGTFYIVKSPDSAKTISFRVFPDYTGDGVIDTNDAIAMTGDDGDDSVDGDGTDLQMGTVYGISGVNYIWMDTVTAPGAAASGETAYVEISCR